MIANSCSRENVDVVLYWAPSMKDMTLTRQAAQDLEVLGTSIFWFDDVFCNFVLWGDRGGIRLQVVNSCYDA